MRMGLLQFRSLGLTGNWIPLIDEALTFMRIFIFSILLITSFGPVAQAEDWPRFRGPSGQGISTETGLPVHWSATSNVMWKTEIPGEGWSSPIIFGDRVFVTTTTENGVSCRVLCVSRKDGKILWNKEALLQVPKRKERMNSYATPTPVTDGQSVFVVFGDGSIASLSNTGEVLWTNRDFKFYSQHGLSASPILYEDLLIMPYDGSSEGEDKKIGWQKPWDQSYIVALDKRTGQLRWKAKRGQSRIAHVTPNILKENGTAQLISGAGDVVQGFDLQTGDRIWSVYSQGEGVVPSIVLGDGLIFTASGFEKSTIRAVRPGGKGDVTKTHIAWEETKGVPTRPSFVYVKPYLFSVTDGGIAMCLKAEPRPSARRARSISFLKKASRRLSKRSPNSK
jgi:outer membrane protein assembly factor BamB